MFLSSQVLWVKSWERDSGLSHCLDDLVRRWLSFHLIRRLGSCVRHVFMLLLGWFGLRSIGKFSVMNVIIRMLEVLSFYFFYLFLYSMDCRANMHCSLSCAWDLHSLIWRSICALCFSLLSNKFLYLWKEHKRLFGRQSLRSLSIRRPFLT